MCSILLKEDYSGTNLAGCCCWVFHLQPRTEDYEATLLRTTVIAVKNLTQLLRAVFA